MLPAVSTEKFKDTKYNFKVPFRSLRGKRGKGFLTPSLSADLAEPSNASFAPTGASQCVFEKQLSWPWKWNGEPQAPWEADSFSQPATGTALRHLTSRPRGAAPLRLFSQMKGHWVVIALAWCYHDRPSSIMASDLGQTRCPKKIWVNDFPGNHLQLFQL